LVHTGHCFCGDDWITFDHQADTRPDPQPARSSDRCRTSDEHFVSVDIVARQIAAPGVGRVPACRDVGVVAEQQLPESTVFRCSSQLARWETVVDWEISETVAHLTTTAEAITHAVGETVGTRN